MANVTGFRGRIIADCSGCGDTIRAMDHYTNTGHTWWHNGCAHKALDASGPTSNALASIAANIHEAYTYLTDGRAGEAVKAMDRIIEDIGRTLSNPAVKRCSNSDTDEDGPGEA